MKIPYLALSIQLVSPAPAIALLWQKRCKVVAIKTQRILAARIKRPDLNAGFFLSLILLRIIGPLTRGLEHCHRFFGLFSREPLRADGFPGALPCGSAKASARTVP